MRPWHPKRAPPPDWSMDCCACRWASKKWKTCGGTLPRPGPSGNESAPNAANYDEALANPFPDLPEVLKLENGRSVTTAQQWTSQRRPEIVELFEREVVGRIPPQVPKVSW